MPASFIKEAKERGRMNLLELRDLLLKYYQPTFTIGQQEEQLVLKTS